ncbi:MAG: hypothetical protein GY861_28445 [bacterium]|nr:hypothetical protein [bacterium]
MIPNYEEGLVHIAKNGLLPIFDSAAAFSREEKSEDAFLEDLRYTQQNYLTPSFTNLLNNKCFTETDKVNKETIEGLLKTLQDEEKDWTEDIQHMKKFMQEFYGATQGLFEAEPKIKEILESFIEKPEITYEPASELNYGTAFQGAN